MVACRPMPIIVLFGAALLLSMLFSVSMPIGPLYWDHYIYLDAAKRIFDGQVPSLDFFAPAGALDYYLFAGFLAVFPTAHPLLIANWCILLVTLPLMAVVLRDVQKRSVGPAFALLLPVLLFSVLPFNTGEFYPYPGSEGFGIYNRHCCQLLYVLACALLFVEDRTRQIVVVILAMLALMFVKITGLACGILLCLTALIISRLALRSAVIAGAMFFAALAALEIVTGIVSSYIADILVLLTMNEGGLLGRVLQAGSLNFGLMAFVSILAVFLLILSLRDIRAGWRFGTDRQGAMLSWWIDNAFVLLSGFTVAGLLYESQNTGSQAFIFLWPALLLVSLQLYRDHGTDRVFAVAAVLVLAVALPPTVLIIQKSARAAVGMVQSQTIESRNLKTMGHVKVRDIFAVRAKRLSEDYVTYRALYQATAETGELPSILLYSNFDFQTLWLTQADAAISALYDYEKQRNIRIETVMSIDFVNPFAWLMDRHAPRYIAIGGDPTRAVPPLDDKARQAVTATDVALYPTCPVTATGFQLLAIYEPILSASHTRIALTPCYDAYIRNDIETSN